MHLSRFGCRRIRANVLLAGVACMAALGGCKRTESAAPAVPAPTPATTSAAGAASKAGAPKAVPDAVQKLLGKWMRSDGGYILELRSADMSGVVDAGYFNPNPIKVSRAIWMQGAEGLQVMVELNDVGYPGATYVLSHDAASDRLVGKYNQPAMQQSFDVDFTRQPKQ